MARRLEELPIYPKATAFCSAVSAILVRPGFGKYRKLREQIDEANDSILSNMAEGFEQPTDAAVERYLYHSKASLAEVLTRMTSAHRKNLVTAKELAEIKADGDQLSRMLAGWIKYLARCDFKDRGRHRGKRSAAARRADPSAAGATGNGGATAGDEADDGVAEGGS